MPNTALSGMFFATTINLAEFIDRSSAGFTVLVYGNKGVTISEIAQSFFTTRILGTSKC